MESAKGFTIDTITIYHFLCTIVVDMKPRFLDDEED